MQVKSIAECSKHSAILSTFIKIPVVIKIFVLSIFEWPFYTGLIVCNIMKRYVRPDLGPNCLQMLSAENTSRQSVIYFFVPMVIQN